MPTPTPPVVVTPPPSNLPPASSVLQISVIGDMWIPTTSAPVQHGARLITNFTPLEYTLATDGVQWSIAPAGVATIDQSGRVTPIAIGTANVTAKYGDKAGTNNIRVLPDYSGEWSGEFVISACTGGSDFRECGRMMFGPIDDNGLITYRKFPFTLSLTQFRDGVTGTIREARTPADLAAPVSGLVRQNGTLVLEANVPVANNQPLQIFNWSSSANAGMTTMSGAFTQIEPKFNGFNTPYTIRTEQEFTNISRVR